MSSGRCTAKSVKVKLRNGESVKVPFATHSVWVRYANVPHWERVGHQAKMDAIAPGVELLVLGRNERPETPQFFAGNREFNAPEFDIYAAKLSPQASFRLAQTDVNVWPTTQGLLLAALRQNHTERISSTKLATAVGAALTSPQAVAEFVDICTRGQRLLDDAKLTALRNPNNRTVTLDTSDPGQWLRTVHVTDPELFAKLSKRDEVSRRAAAGNPQVPLVVQKRLMGNKDRVPKNTLLLNPGTDPQYARHTLKIRRGNRVDLAAAHPGLTPQEVIHYLDHNKVTSYAEDQVFCGLLLRGDLTPDLAQGLVSRKLAGLQTEKGAGYELESRLIRNPHTLAALPYETLITMSQRIPIAGVFGTTTSPELLKRILAEDKPQNLNAATWLLAMLRNRGLDHDELIPEIKKYMLPVAAKALPGANLSPAAIDHLVSTNYRKDGSRSEELAQLAWHPNIPKATLRRLTGHPAKTVVSAALLADKYTQVGDPALDWERLLPTVDNPFTTVNNNVRKQTNTPATSAEMLANIVTSDLSNDDKISAVRLTADWPAAQVHALVGYVRGSSGPLRQKPTLAA